MEERPVVDLLLAVGSFAVGSVEPLFEDLAISAVVYALKGLDIYVIVLRSAVMGIVAVPGGDVDTELQALCGASLG